MKTMVLYTKLGCHLCEAAEAVIDSVRGEFPFHFVRRYITEDPADYERYKHNVPVIVVEGVEVARHRVTRELLITALR